MKRLGLVLATAGGAGYFPFAPGTVGSAVGVVLYLVLRTRSIGTEAGVLIAIAVAGTWASQVAAAHFQREDPGYVVIDEVAGQLLTLFATGASVWGIVLGFFLFRILDIIKPWPARGFERFPGGYGIMADDLMVGVYGNAILRLVQYAYPGIF